MKRVLVTGGTGFIGKNIVASLSEKYEVIAPRREALDLMNEKAVYMYLERIGVDSVIHCANPVRSKIDQSTRILEQSMRLFINFYEARHLYNKLLYLGSGAEYDKTRSLDLVREDAVTESIPKDEYGFAKHMMNILTRQSQNVYNLRLFACYGPFEHESRFITHAIKCCLNKQPITIRQDCLFDYMHVQDLAYIIEWFIENKPLFHDYNVCSGKPVALSEIAHMVSKKMGRLEVECLNNSYGLNYTGDNTRLLQEMGDFKSITLDKGIDQQIIWLRREQHEVV